MLCALHRWSWTFHQKAEARRWIQGYSDLVQKSQHDTRSLKARRAITHRAAISQQRNWSSLQSTQDDQNKSIFDDDDYELSKTLADHLKSGGDAISSEKNQSSGFVRRWEQDKPYRKERFPNESLLTRRRRRPLSKDELKEMNQTQIIKEFAALIRSVARASKEKVKGIYLQCEAILESLPNESKKSYGIYTPMIRLAVHAGKIQRAFDLLKEMVDHGLPASIFSYRAIFQNISQPGLIHAGDYNIITQAQNVYEAMISDWKEAVTKWEEGDIIGMESKMRLDEDKIHGEIDEYALHRQMVIRADIFVANCSYYMLLLLMTKCFDEANILLEKSIDISSSSKTMQTLIPHLPTILASRYTNTIAGEKTYIDPNVIRPSLMTAYSTIISNLFDANIRQKVTKHFYPLSDTFDDPFLYKERERYAIDISLTNLLLCFDKIFMPGRDQLIPNALISIYNDESLASLPPLADEVGLRPMFRLCKRMQPLLCLEIFERAIKYHETMEYRDANSNSYPARLRIPDQRDALSIWTNALDIAIVDLDNVEKAFSILQSAKIFKRGNTRLRTVRMPMNYSMSHFMKKLYKDNDLIGGLRLLNFHLDDEKEKRRGKEPVYLCRFITHFLNLAIRSEETQKQRTPAQDETEEELKLKRPSEIGMEYLIKEIGVEDPIWNWCQAVITDKSTASDGVESRKTEFDPLKSAKEFLAVVVSTSQLAKNSIMEKFDSSSNPTVELCKGLIAEAENILVKKDASISEDG